MNGTILNENLDMHHLSLVTVFNKKIFSIIRPSANYAFRIHDPMGLSFLTELRVGLSKVNFYKFKRGYGDTVNPMCLSSNATKDAEHFLLLCSSFDAQRRDLLV